MIATATFLSSMMRVKVMGKRVHHQRSGAAMPSRDFTPFFPPGKRRNGDRRFWFRANLHVFGPNGLVIWDAN